MVIVGVDVAMNMTLPKYLMENCGLSVSKANMGNSIYFFSRTIGALLGGIVLMKLPEKKVYILSIVLGVLGLILMLASSKLWFIIGCVALFGIGYANLFSIIFSLSLKRIPDKANEISALLIVGVSGGAVLPPIVGIVTDTFQSQMSAIVLIIIVWSYLIWLTRKVN